MEGSSNRGTSSHRSTSQSDPDACSICHERLERVSDENPLVKLTPCEHIVHKVCIVPWFNGHDTCPICREVVVSYTELATDGSITTNVTNVPRRVHNYPSPNSFVFLPVTEEVSISYIFMADAFILRTGGSVVEFLRTDRLPSRVQFTVSAQSMVPIYHLIISQAKHYVLKIDNSFYNLEILLTSIARRMSSRRINTITAGSLGSNDETAPTDQQSSSSDPSPPADSSTPPSSPTMDAS